RLHLCLPASVSNTPPTPDIYTLSLHDALPISHRSSSADAAVGAGSVTGGESSYTQLASAATTSMPERNGRRNTRGPTGRTIYREDRKSTRLNSSHSQISYAVFCLKKKKNSSQH